MVTKSASTFRIETTVKVAIRATPAAIWRLLTDAAKFPSWNSTVTSIDGTIAQGQKLALRVPAAPKRVFKPKVVELEPEKRMVWAEGAAPMFKGVRTYTLSPNADGTTEFTMTEVLRGLAVPMAKGSLPDFGPIFETYAKDLAKAAESARS
ncbi:MAG: SRPBCC domain-containing protein [Kofleriaceae bacterium]